MMIVIRTQYHENYGAHDWDGTGECPQYWKAKGGTEYKILDVPLNIDYNEFVKFALTGIETDTDYSSEYMVDWSMESDDYLSWFERSQLQFDGAITSKEPAMTYQQVLDKQRELA